MKFEIIAKQAQSGEVRTFVYDNMTNQLSADGQVIARAPAPAAVAPHPGFDKSTPLKKSRTPRLLKVQLGLSCNYTCDYCSQRFVERAPETSKKHIDEFLAKLDALHLSEEEGLKIEFWGGEPLVYWKTLKPLAEALRDKYDWVRPIQFSIITNGSLLTDEICDWLYDMGFWVSISHDGPGQSVRGPDPLDDPETRRVVLEFYRRMRPLGRFSFNAMLNNKSTSRAAVYDWFVELTGDPAVPLGEGDIVDAYDEGGQANSLHTTQEHFDFRKRSFAEIFGSDGRIGFVGIIEKIDQFILSVLNQQPNAALGQKCGMDRPDALAIDLRGNVLTCQNVSSVQAAPNGESHLCGTLDDFDNVAVKSATHWARRPHCAGCPVLGLCKGACMFLEGDNWTASCANAYSNNVALFALALEKITGFVPLYIDGNLPAERADIWGDMVEHKPQAARKPFPVKVVVQHQELDGVGVYSKAAVEVA